MRTTPSRADAQGELDRLLEEHPLPADCGILALGDINGVSRYRGVQTLLLPDCAEVYTRLEPGRAENKGSHALVVLRKAFLAYAQAIVENGVTDCATSRIGRYGDLAAYGLFRHPLFTQHKFPDGGHRLPELFAYNGRAGLEERFRTRPRSRGCCCRTSRAASGCFPTRRART